MVHVHPMKYRAPPRPEPNAISTLQRERVPRLAPYFLCTPYTVLLLYGRGRGLALEYGFSTFTRRVDELFSVL